MERPFCSPFGLFRLMALLVAGWLLTIAGPVAALAQKAGALDLQSHRAVYRIQLADGGVSRDFARAEGRFVLEWQKSCQGATLNQRLVTEFIPFEGETLLSDLRFSSWEAADGSTLRFSLTNLINGTVSEEAEGTADRKQGKVTFTNPGDRTTSLPDGTVFPTMLTELLIDAAVKGETILNRTVYDGAEDGEAMKSTAFIGVRKAAKGSETFKEIEGGEVLADLPYWPVTLGYFERDEMKDLPEYQVSFHLYTNGISDSLTLDYVDFRLKAKLTELTLLDTPACP